MKISGDDPDVASAYDRWAATYDSDRNPTRELAAAVLRRSGLEHAGRSVLEIGCGTGRNTLWLAEQAASVVALDFSEGMLRRARELVRSSKVQFARHDVRAPWPMPDHSADVVIAMLVLEHLERLAPIFAEAARVLRSKGDLLVCELHPARQRLGRQAEFRNPRAGEQEKVVAFLHDVSDYVNAGLEAGLRLAHLGEWRDADAEADEAPRILSLRFRADL